MDMITCCCAEHDGAPCKALATEEDFLCEACRPGGCVAVYIDGEPAGHHSPAMEVTSAEGGLFILEAITVTSARLMIGVAQPPDPAGSGV